MDRKWFAAIICFILLTIGCSTLPGEKVVVPEGSSRVPGQEPGTSFPMADGFDYPVGDRHGNGWAITGYGWLDESRVSNSLHPGEDWNIPGAGDGDYGKPVRSIAHGRVRHSLWNSALGHVVVIEHRLSDGRRVWSQYAHLAERWVVQGEDVARGQQIGTVGKGPNNRFLAHLHFEIRKADLAANAWPRTNGQAWPAAQVEEYWLEPSKFINENRP
ncbi:MAG: M23 family metallopeptidase [Limnochordia bacterium]